MRRSARLNIHSKRCKLLWSVCAKENGVTRCRNQRGAILERTLAILEQIVQHRQHVAFGTFNTFENQNRTGRGGTHHRAVLNVTDQR
jgi:nucleoid DNA-binding protein